MADEDYPAEAINWLRDHFHLICPANLARFPIFPNEPNKTALHLWTGDRWHELAGFVKFDNEGA